MKQLLLSVSLLFAALSSYGQIELIERDRNADVERLNKEYTAALTRINGEAAGKYDRLRRQALYQNDLGQAEKTDLRIKQLQAPVATPQSGELPPMQDLTSVTIPVDSDRNIVAKGAEVNEDYYWIDKDGTQGVVEFRFTDKRLDSPLPPKAATLQVFAPAVSQADSIDYVYVYCGAKKAGQFHGAKPGNWIDIPLDVSVVPTRSSQWIIQLRPVGNDGAAIASKNSGNGAKLTLTY